MGEPSQFREHVHLGGGNHESTMRAQTDGPIARNGDPLAQEMLRDGRSRQQLLRNYLHREPAPGDAGQGAHIESLSREPLNLDSKPEGAASVIGGRLAGTPLPGSANHAGSAARELNGQRQVPPGRSLSPNTPAGATTTEDPSAMQRAMGLLKQAAPFVARLLPLVEGNVAGAVANLLAQRPHPPAPPVDLTPVHGQIAELQAQHSDLRTSVQEQTTSIKRVEDQLEMVREATDRNTLEQQELIEDLKKMGSRVSLVALGISILLLVSIGVNLWLYLYIKRVLP